MKHVLVCISVTVLVFQPKKAGSGFLPCQMMTEWRQCWDSQPLGCSQQPSSSSRLRPSTKTTLFSEGGKVFLTAGAAQMVQGSHLSCRPVCKLHQEEQMKNGWKLGVPVQRQAAEHFSKASARPYLWKHLLLSVRNRFKPRKRRNGVRHVCIDGTKHSMLGLVPVAGH